MNAAVQQSIEQLFEQLPRDSKLQLIARFIQSLNPEIEEELELLEEIEDHVELQYIDMSREETITLEEARERILGDSQ